MNPARAATRLAMALVFLLASAASAPAAPDKDDASVDHATWVDHDARPVPKPKERKISLYSYMFRQAIAEPISHAFDIPDKLLWLTTPFGVTRKPASTNVNAFDEAPNSTWFTNRNTIRAVRPDEIRTGPFEGVAPEKPWTVKDVKKSGYNAGFQIKDAQGRKWLVKLDRKGYPQCGSGAGTVVSRLAWAAGYNIALYQSVSFRREDLRFERAVATAGPGKTVDAKLASTNPATGDPPITETEVDAILRGSATSSDGRYYASASLFLPGKPAGPVDLGGRREDDPNDWYHHKNRRELRGLYVFYSWLNNWDVKDQQTLDMYGKPDDPAAHLTHYLLDVDGSLGAGAEGAKPLPYGYEMRIDFPWTVKRLMTLGFVEEPWRKSRQATGIPSVGNFESREFHPAGWRPLQEVVPFRKMTPRDGYWGAKLVASFSDTQIAAAIDAAHYEDPRATEYLLPALIERREKVARYWFDRVAPLDFFHVENGALVFRDLALDLGLTGPREYEVEIDGSSGSDGSDRARLRSTAMLLPRSKDSRLTLTLSIAGSHAAPVRVEVKRNGSDWVVTRVRHA